MHDVRGRTRKEDRLVAIVPSDGVTHDTTLRLDLEDLAFALRLHPCVRCQRRSRRRALRTWLPPFQGKCAPNARRLGESRVCGIRHRRSSPARTSGPGSGGSPTTPDERRSPGASGRAEQPSPPAPSYREPLPRATARSAPGARRRWAPDSSEASVPIRLRAVARRSATSGATSQTKQESSLVVSAASCSAWDRRPFAFHDASMITLLPRSSCPRARSSSAV